MGDDSVLAAGALLRDVLPALKKLSHGGQVFRFKPTAPKAVPVFDALATLVARVGQGQDVDDVFDQLKVRGWRTAKAPHPGAGATEP